MSTDKIIEQQKKEIAALKRELRWCKSSMTHAQKMGFTQPPEGELLAWYVEHVIGCEGTDFTNNFYDDESRENLKKISKLHGEKYHEQT